MIDQYGRNITKETHDGLDIYTVDNKFSISFNEGTDLNQVMNTINAMAPG